MPSIEKMSKSLWDSYLTGGTGGVPTEIGQKVREGRLLIIDDATNISYVPYPLDPYSWAIKELDQTISTQAYAFMSPIVMKVFIDHPDKDFNSDEVHSIVDEEVSRMPFIKNPRFFLNLQLDSLLHSLETKLSKIEKMPTKLACDKLRYRLKLKDGA